MADKLLAIYDRLVLGRPWLILMLMALFVLAFGTQIPKIKLDASADSLMLQGDPSLDFYRDIAREYSSEEFVIITWQPAGDLLADESLQPMRAMADEMRQLEGVSSVLTVWDVPLLESPPVSLSDITSGEPLPSLTQPGIDRDLVLKELTTSPIYADLLTSRDGRMSAVQINIKTDEHYDALLQQREDLRRQHSAGELDSSGLQILKEAEQAFKSHSAITMERQGQLVADVRRVAAAYTGYADLFVGGVPMIAADMVSYVRSDLVLFGTAILGIMVLMLAVIFRRLRWVVIPLTTSTATVTVMLGLLGALDWRMTVISSNFVALLLIISLALSIHLIVRYRELHLADPEGELRQRVLRTVQLMAVPCFYTAITTIVAFISLVVSGIQPVIDFGWMMTVGISLALLMAFAIVPCLMLVWRGAELPPAHHSDTPFTLYFARLADRFSSAILVLSLALFGVCVYGISKLEVENRFIDYFHESTEIYQGMELLDARLGGTIPLDIIVYAPDDKAPLPGLELNAAAPQGQPLAADDAFADDAESFGDDAWGDEFDSDFDEFAGATADSFKPSYWFSLEGMRELDALHGHVDSLPQTGKVLSLSTTFEVVKNLMGEDIGSVELALVQKSLPADVAALMVDPYFSAAREQARITVRVKETSRDLQRNEFLLELQRYLQEDLGLAPERFEFTGMLVLYNNVLQSLFRSQILTLGAVLIAILVMFLMLFRSLSLSLIALAPNVLAAGMVLGVMGLAGIPLDIMNITVTSIVIGIGVDNCIHYVHRFMREFPQDRDYRATMYRCHGSIGRALYYTFITVVIGFSMLTLSNFNPSIYFGMLTVLAMTVALVGALLLMPCLIVLLKPLGPERD